jgi:hypothetical protein
MAKALELEKETEMFQWKDILKKDYSLVKNRRRLVLCFLIQMLQQFTGINVIAFVSSQTQPIVV